MIPWPKIPQPFFKKFFLNLNYTTPLVITGFEQLSSSICCRVMAGQSFPWKGKLCHADFDLVFNKTLSQKSGLMGWGPEPAKGGQNFQNMPSLWHHLQKTPTEKEKRFLQCQLDDLLNL